MKVYTIAESAFNHNGDVEYLRKLASASKEAGADYFTIQVMDVDSFCDKEYEKYKVYVENSISFSEWEDFISFCSSSEISLIPCVLDMTSFKFCRKFDFNIYKIHATDICNKFFLEELSKHPCAYILETQCATYQDIDFALSFLKEKVFCLMHGFSNYPTEIDDLQLNALDYLKEYFPGKQIGFADHSVDLNAIPSMALAKGITFIEKHITLERDHSRFDWQVSLSPDEFKVFVNNITNNSHALGKALKHPVKNELKYRDIIYKKYIGPGIFIRSDKGKDYLTSTINAFDKKNVVIAVIARLKSVRLKKKVLCDINGKPLIIQLINRLEKAKKVNQIFLATSPLPEDKELVDIVQSHGKKVFYGHPVSVIDRMLSLALDCKCGAIFRVTGDNLLTDPFLIDEMLNLFDTGNLDYVRVNNVPFGVSAELFSVSYLWNLYLNIENPLNSEYLSWFIINDNSARRGALKIKTKDDRIKYSNLSIDYSEDYQRAVNLLGKINKNEFADIKLEEIINNIDLSDLIPEDKIIKLPERSDILLKDYLSLLDNLNYSIVKELEI
jgi:N,N'-diacetyllegionaminate synthase